MKRVKINNNKVVNIVMETLERDGVFVADTKIDKVIQGYLIEREDLLLDDESPIDVDGFSDESKSAFDDMCHGLETIVQDLSIIQVKENGFVVDNLLAEDYIEEVMDDLVLALEKLEYIKGLE